MTPDEIEFLDSSILYHAFVMDSATNEFDETLARATYEALQIIRKTLAGSHLEVFEVMKRRHVEKMERGLLEGKYRRVGNLVIPNIPIALTSWQGFSKVSAEMIPLK